MQSETREKEYSVCRNKQAETEVAGMAESEWTGNGRGKGEPKMMAALGGVGFVAALGARLMDFGPLAAQDFDDGTLSGKSVVPQLHAALAL